LVRVNVNKDLFRNSLTSGSSIKIFSHDRVKRKRQRQRAERVIQMWLGRWRELNDFCWLTTQ
jgi:hypothetical protein